MPQLTSTATIHGFALNSLRWAYHANVMNTLLNIKRNTVKPAARIISSCV